MVKIRFPFRAFEFLLHFLDVNVKVVGTSDDGIYFKCDVLYSEVSKYLSYCPYQIVCL
jgi:hypothetical protein